MVTKENSMKIFTIGFTQTTAEDFFQRLSNAQVKRVIDVRLNNTSQLSGFAKAKDLKYFLRVVGEIEYLYEPLLAPTKEILDNYKKQKGSWEEYENRFIDLMGSRKIEDKLDPEILSDGCLLCSEAKPHNCHRTLVSKYLKEKWNQSIQVIHL
jgi:uncharacterized protein (DUF488 family)